MSPEYKNLRAKADSLWYRFKDQADDMPAARGLFEEVRDIVEMFEMNKNPHSIEDRIKHIVEEFKSLRYGNGEEMDFRHVDEFIENYEELRKEVRRLPNY